MNNSRTRAQDIDDDRHTADEPAWRHELRQQIDLYLAVIGHAR
jgi:hypothetical protein